MSAPVLDVILFQPEIPPNTGNVIRLCANTGARLHLIEPLGFDLSDKQLKRAGLDYHEYAPLKVHVDLPSALAAIAPKRVFALSTRSTVRYDTPQFADGDAFCSARKPAACQPRCWSRFRRSTGSVCPCARTTAASICPTPLQ